MLFCKYKTRFSRHSLKMSTCLLKKTCLSMNLGRSFGQSFMHVVLHACSFCLKIFHAFFFPFCRDNTETKFPCHKSSSCAMKIYEDSCMICTNGCGQPNIKSRYYHCQSPILKRPQLAKIKNKLQTAIL